MKPMRRLSSFGLALLVAMLTGMAAASADCQYLTAFNQMIEQKNADGAKAIEDKITKDAACGPYAIEVQRRRALLQVTMAEALSGRSERQAERERLIVDADSREVAWTAAFALGDLRYGQRRYSEATQAFDRAIEIIKNETRTPKAPRVAIIQEIIDRGAQSRLLAANEEGPTAGSYVQAAKDHRDGSLGGAFSPDVRGLKPRSVPLPINFTTGTANFTPLGLQSLADLATAVKEQAPTEVIVVGHTDERGADAMNMKLSEQRARAVGDYLTTHGVTASIKVLPRGKQEPLKIEDKTGLSQQDVWALNRRVEWRRP